MTIAICGMNQSITKGRRTKNPQGWCNPTNRHIWLYLVLVQNAMTWRVWFCSNFEYTIIAMPRRFQLWDGRSKQPQQEYHTISLGYLVPSIIANCGAFVFISCRVRFRSNFECYPYSIVPLRHIQQCWDRNTCVCVLNSYQGLLTPYSN